MSSAVRAAVLASFLLFARSDRRRSARGSRGRRCASPFGDLSAPRCLATGARGFAGVSALLEHVRHLDRAHRTPCSLLSPVTAANPPGDVHRPDQRLSPLGDVLRWFLLSSACCSSAQGGLWRSEAGLALPVRAGASSRPPDGRKRALRRRPGRVMPASGLVAPVVHGPPPAGPVYLADRRIGALVDPATEPLLLVPRDVPTSWTKRSLEPVAVIAPSTFARSALIFTERVEQVERIAVP